MNIVNEYDEKRNGFAEVAEFCHVTCRYFDRFLLQVDRNWRQARVYLASGVICEGYWQVNSRRSIFGIADPTFAYSAIMRSKVSCVLLQTIITAGDLLTNHARMLNFSAYRLYFHLEINFEILSFYIETILAS